jgi:hypothetical protein
VNRLSLVLVLLIGALAFAGPGDGSAWGTLPSDPLAARAEVEQRVLPALRARLQSAERRVTARQAYFAGRVALGEAFPDLAEASLDEPAVVDGLLVALDDRAQARAPERVAPIPDLRSRYRQDLLSRTLKRALDAEDSADALERRLLLAIRGHLAAHPETASAGLQPLRAQLELRLAEAVEAARVAAEGEGEEAARRVAEADAERVALEALVQALRTVATVPGTAPPEPAPDLAQLDDPETTDIARVRLTLLRPFLAPEDQVRVDEAEAGWITRTRLPALRETLAEAEAVAVGAGEELEGADPDVLSALLISLETLVEEQRARVDALPDGEEGSLAAVRKEAAVLDLRILESRHRAATSRLEAVEALTTTATTEAQRARVEAEEALAVAETARREARGQSEIRVAELRTSAAEAHQSAAEAWEAVREVEAALDTRSTERHDELALFTSRAGEVEVALGLGQEEVDALYQELRDFIGELRSEAAEASGAILEAQDARQKAQADATAARTEIRAARTAGEALADEALRASWTEALERWDQALDDQVRARGQAASLLQGDRDDIVHVLLAAKSVRRGLFRRVSPAEREADRGELLVDLGHELQLMGPTLVAGGRERLRALVGLPRALLDFNFITGVLRGSFLALLLAVGWWYLRRGTPRLAGYLLTRLRRWNDRLRPAELHRLRGPLERFLRPMIDLIFGWLLLKPVYALLPELGFLLRVYLYIAAYRFVLGAFELAVLRHPEDRLAVVRLAAGTWDLARRTVRVAVVWWLARRFARYLLLGLLDADVLDAVVRFGINLFGLLLVARLLHEWEPLLRARMQRLHASGVVRFLSRDPPHWSLRFLQSIAILGYFAGAGVSSIFNRLAREQEGVGRLFNVVTRYRLKGEDTTEALRPVSQELFDALTTGDLAQGAYIYREEVDAALVDALDAWRREQRQGLALLVGDRGAGKRTAVDHFIEARVQGSTGLLPLRVRLGRRMTTREEVLGGLASMLSLDQVPDTAEDLAGVLNSHEPMVYILEDMHHAFLRTVNGFDGLRTLLYVLNACAQRHFWLLTMHGPAWQYLSRLTALVNTGVFRSVIELPPMGPAHLQTLTLNRMVLLGYEPDFSPLLRSNPFGAEPEVELERTRNAFFRLLAEASNGNPAVALRVFAECLAPGAEDGAVRVHMVNALTLGAIDALTEADLFTLVALRTQDLLDEQELVAVTNMSPATVRNTVKLLEQRGLVVEEGHRVTIPQSELPAVTRTLRRRNFLQG